MGRERAQIREFARREIMLELLDVLDKFHLSMGKAADYQDFDSLLQAMKIVESELKTFMERVGLQRFDAEGQAFDPDLHAAMTQAPTADVAPGTVIKQIRPGYRLGDHVLQPSQVVVARAPDETNEPAAKAQQSADET